MFLWALAATALAGPATLWSPWPRGLLEDSTITSSEFAAFTTIVFVLPIFLLPLGAYLSDRAAILGSRREGYLVLGSLLTAITWGAAPFVPRAFGPWLVIGVGLYTANALTRVAVEGGLAEIGQRRRSTGRLSAAALGLGSAAGLAAYPLLDRLLQRPLGWTAAVGAIAGLSVAVIALRALQTIAPAEVAPPPPARVGPWLRSRPFGTGLLVLAGGAFPQARARGLRARSADGRRTSVHVDGELRLDGGQRSPRGRPYVSGCGPGGPGGPVGPRHARRPPRGPGRARSPAVTGHGTPGNGCNPTARPDRGAHLRVVQRRQRRSPGLREASEHPLRLAPSRGSSASKEHPDDYTHVAQPAVHPSSAVPATG